MIGLWKPSRYGWLLLICACSAAVTGCGPVSSFTAVQTGLTRQITAAALPGKAVTAAALAGLAEGTAASDGHGAAGDGCAGPGAARGMAAAEPWNTVSGSGGKTEFPDYLESDTGLFAYYNQGDSRWAEELFGPSDPIRTHGCGPTVLAMLVSSYTSNPLLPPQAALWASQNGCCIPGEGSTHAIIGKGAAAFGLSAASLSPRSSDAILDALKDGQVVVALMGPGYFSNSGHFIIIIRSLEDGTVRIADPGNAENCFQNWDIPFLISQLKKNASNGGPLWTVGYQEPFK